MICHCQHGPDAPVVHSQQKHCLRPRDHPRAGRPRTDMGVESGIPMQASSDGILHACVMCAMHTMSLSLSHGPQSHRFGSPRLSSRALNVRLTASYTDRHRKRGAEHACYFITHEQYISIIRTVHTYVPGRAICAVCMLSLSLCYVNSEAHGSPLGLSHAPRLSAIRTQCRMTAGRGS